MTELMNIDTRATKLDNDCRLYDSDGRITLIKIAMKEYADFLCAKEFERATEAEEELAKVWEERDALANILRRFALYDSVFYDPRCSCLTCQAGKLIRDIDARAAK